MIYNIKLEFDKTAEISDAQLDALNDVLCKAICSIIDDKTMPYLKKVTVDNNVFYLGDKR